GGRRGQESGDRSGRRRRRSGDRRGLAVRADRARAKDLLVQLPGLGVRRSAELSLQRVDAVLVLAQGGFAAAQARIETHDHAMDGLLQGVQREEAKAGMDGGLEGSGLLLVDETITRTANTIRVELKATSCRGWGCPRGTSELRT